MNLLLRIFAVGTLLTAAHTFAASAFEGRVSLTMSDSKGRSHTINYAMKGRLMRMDMDAEGHSMSTIMDMDKLQMMMLMPQQSMYMVMPIKGVTDAAQKQSGEHPYDSDVEKTGRSEKILGYSCDEYVMTDKNTGHKTNLWLAEGLGTFMGLGSGGGGPMMGARASSPAASWESKFKGKSGFPLRVVTHDAGGKEQFKMEATKIEPGSLPDDLFVPPAGYKKFQMPDLGGLNPFRQG